ncbi:hypothetical protein MUCCIDRAFT_168133 [Mucor lusitanicus CBS 277.49]|uniref:Tetraspanin n=1 Tax=Mucor lusitanicus CBS 277.49 TaxID=747725 RepID=A0A168GSY7_MUCCL|nr:hypothetical protein MUCCIDRAFT_168133 [Mucor lusitanicus CBS 277.49]
MACCQKQSSIYLVLTNILFFLCGCILLAFGMMATQMKITDSILFPVNILKMVTILGLILVFTSLVGILGGYYRERRKIHVLYTTLVVVAFIYQISVAVIVYDQAAHTSSWMSDTWNNSTKDYRLYAQKKFNCCGFSHPMDHAIATSTCFPDHIINSAQPCYGPLTRFVQLKLSHMYIALFTSLAIELLALCNKWEVSPEEQHYVHHDNYSADTLVPSNATTMQSKPRQF